MGDMPGDCAGDVTSLWSGGASEKIGSCAPSSIAILPKWDTENCARHLAVAGVLIPA
jgi:hypothetical protein